MVSKKKEKLDGKKFKKLLISAYKHFEKYIEKVNSLNVYPVPDGDTGTNMGLTLKAAVEGILKTDNKNIGLVADMAAENALLGARGNSGVILSQMLRGIARGLKFKETATPLEMAKAFQYGVLFAYRSVSKPVEGTILTVAREIAKGAKKASRESNSMEVLFEEATKSGYKAVKNTKNQLPALKEADVVDAGALGFVLIIEGFLKGLKGELKEEEILNLSSQIIEPQEKKHEEFTFPYCTELIIKGNNIRYHRLREELQELGDSLIIGESENIAKVHIHTNHPGAVLELCLKRGTIHDIKIDNMIDQHNRSLDFEDSSKDEETDSQKTNFIAVSNGEGIEEIFKNLGASKIITGGATMNPQVKDFVEAIRETKGDLVILPNNKNIRLAAEQAAQYVKRDVIVIPTDSIPEGIAAAFVFDSDLDVFENEKAMKERLKEVKTAEITYAVRSTSIDNLTLSKGDFLGIIDGEIKYSGKELDKAVENIIQEIVDEETEIITLFYGKEVTQEEAEGFLERLENLFPEVEIEIHMGGQPLYYYFIIVE